MTRRPLPVEELPRPAHASALVGVFETADHAIATHLDRYVRRFDMGRMRRSQQDLPEIAMRIARSLRAGCPLEQALMEAADTGHPSLIRVREQLIAGRPIGDAVDDWASTAASEPERLLVAALSLGRETGGNLASATDLVGAGIRDDLQLDARRRTLLTQSRLSAGLLVALPVVFATLASVLQGRVIYQGVGGLFLVSVGGVLDLLGLLWIRRLLRGLT